jgi:hypothetical protein
MGRISASEIFSDASKISRAEGKFDFFLPALLPPPPPPQIISYALILTGIAGA